MKTIQHDMNDYLLIATNYYNEMLKKNFDMMSCYLHPEVILISPLAEIVTKDAVISAAKNLTQILTDIKIRSKFASENEIMFAYDFMFLEPIGKLRAAVLMEFKDKLIFKIELFYDARPFVENKTEIFEK